MRDNTTRAEAFIFLAVVCLVVAGVIGVAIWAT